MKTARVKAAFIGSSSTREKVLAILMCMAMAVSVTACGGKDKGETARISPDELLTADTVSDITGAIDEIVNTDEATANSIKKLFEMLPYVVTIVILITTSLMKKKENQPPAALGLPYFREER